MQLRSNKLHFIALNAIIYRILVKCLPVFYKGATYSKYNLVPALPSGL